MLLFWDIYNRLKRGWIDDVENVPWKIGFCETCKLFKRINLTALKLVFLSTFNLFYYLCSCTSIILKSVLKQSFFSLYNLIYPYFHLWLLASSLPLTRGYTATRSILFFIIFQQITANFYSIST